MSAELYGWPRRLTRLARERLGTLRLVKRRAFRLLGDNLKKGQQIDDGNLLDRYFGDDIARCLKRLRKPAPPVNAKVIDLDSWRDRS